MHRLTLAVSFLLAAATAQAVPPVAELARRAHELVRQLTQLQEIEQPNDEQRTAYAAALQALDDLAARTAALPDLTIEHYVEVSSPMLQDFAPQALLVCTAGLKRFPDARFLWDHQGMAHTAIGLEHEPGGARTAALTAAAAAFEQALRCTPDTFHAHLGLYQALSHLDQCERALLHLETAAQDAQGKAALGPAWRHRASLLLRAGRHQEALALLGSAEVPAADRRPAAILALRAHALAGDAGATLAAIGRLQKDWPGVHTLVAAADALAFLGRKQEAQKLLATRPARVDFETDEERIELLLVQSAAAMEACWKATDWSAKGPLRRALTKALGHRFLVADPAQKPPGKQTDLAGSPVLMAQMLVEMPASPQKDWGNRVLQALCVRALKDHRPSALETLIAPTRANQRLPDAADLPGLFLAMRFDLGDPEACGVLTGLYALQKLGLGKATEPAKK